MSHLLDHQCGGILVNHLVYCGHDAHFHQGLDDLSGLDGHLLRQVGNRDIRRQVNLMDDRRRGTLEAMFLRGGNGDAPGSLRLFLAATALVCGNVQL